MASACLAMLPSLPDDPAHPAQVTLRTYGLALSLSLVPSVTPVLLKAVTSRTSPKSQLTALARILKRELNLTGSPFAFTLAVGGGSALRALWNGLEGLETRSADEQRMSTRVLQRLQGILRYLDLTPSQRTFISHCITSSAAIVLLQTGRQRPRKPSPTLDLTLLLFVRALDAVLQTFVFHRSSRVRDYHRDESKTAVRPDDIRQRLLKEKHDILEKERRDVLTTRLDGLFFWASSARIMWCWIYKPTKLPGSYVRWINALANVDPRLIDALRLIQAKKWSYIHGSKDHLSVLQTYSQDLGYPFAWGDPNVVPAFGGPAATAAWAALPVGPNRAGVGGLPCELVHGGAGTSLGLDASCTTNAALRLATGLAQSIIIYLPVHFLPILLTRPQLLLRPHRALTTFLGSLRSAAFLSAFISSLWYTLCLTRTLGLARLFPSISHDFWDGPYGGTLAGCLMCGSSIWIEHPKRRGEISLYVIPRAIRSMLPEKLVSSGNRKVLLLERLVFVLSLSSLVTTMIHRSDSLRGLSRWALAFVVNGPNAGFWQKRRSFDPSTLATPVIPPTPPSHDTQSPSDV